MADKISIKVNGIPEALSKLKKYQLRKKAQIKDELLKTAFKVEGFAKDTVPVKTGHLRSKISIDVSDIGLLVVRVGTDVKYAPYVEFGTRVMRARPYLFPAFFAYENDAIKGIGRILKKDIGLK